jgi:predicted nucleic acid-binding protein
LRFYLDASFLVPLFVDDDWTERAKGWAAGDPEVLVSDWVVTEFSSALSHHVRRRSLDADERNEAENALDGWLAGRVVKEPIDPDDVIAARALLHRHGKLRAPDALHLAVVLRLGVGLVTYDGDLADAARGENVLVVTP